MWCKRCQEEVPQATTGWQVSDTPGGNTEGIVDIVVISYKCPVYYIFIFIKYIKLNSVSEQKLLKR